MKRVPILIIAILLFGAGFESAAAATPSSGSHPSVYAAETARAKPRPQRKQVRRVRRTGTYIPYRPNSVPIPYLRLSPAMRREANRRILDALID